MSPTEPPPALGPADLDAVKAVVAAALAEAQSPSLLMTAIEARGYVGLSKSGWFRAASAGLLPKPVHVEGSGERYRRRDLDQFVERLKPRRKQR